MMVGLFFSCLNWPPNCENGFFFALTHFPIRHHCIVLRVKWNFFSINLFWAGLGWAGSTKEEENLLIQLEKRTPPIIVSQTAMGKNGGIFFFLLFLLSGGVSLILIYCRGRTDGACCKNVCGKNFETFGSPFSQRF